jgi:hypothetical protein
MAAVYAMLPPLTQQFVTLGLVMVPGLGFSTLPLGHTNGPVLVALLLAFAHVNTTCSSQQCRIGNASVTGRHQHLPGAENASHEGLHAAAAGGRLLETMLDLLPLRLSTQRIASRHQKTWSAKCAWRTKHKSQETTEHKWWCKGSVHSSRCTYRLGAGAGARAGRRAG